MSYAKSVIKDISMGIIAGIVLIVIFYLYARYIYRWNTARLSSLIGKKYKIEYFILKNKNLPENEQLKSDEYQAIVENISYDNEKVTARLSMKKALAEDIIDNRNISWDIKEDCSPFMSCINL